MRIPSIYALVLYSPAQCALFIYQQLQLIFADYAILWRCTCAYVRSACHVPEFSLDTVHVPVSEKVLARFADGWNKLTEDKGHGKYKHFLELSEEFFLKAVEIFTVLLHIKSFAGLPVVSRASPLPLARETRSANHINFVYLDRVFLNGPCVLESSSI